MLPDLTRGRNAGYARRFDPDDKERAVVMLEQLLLSQLKELSSLIYGVRDDADFHDDMVETLERGKAKYESVLATLR